MTLNLFNVLKLHNNDGDQSSNDGPHWSGKVVQRPTTSSSSTAADSNSRGAEAPAAPRRQTASASGTPTPAEATDVQQRYWRRSSTNEKESETYFWIMWRW